MFQCDASASSDVQAPSASVTGVALSPDGSMPQWRDGVSEYTYTKWRVAGCSFSFSEDQNEAQRSGRTAEVGGSWGPGRGRTLSNSPPRWDKPGRGRVMRSRGRFVVDLFLVGLMVGGFVRCAKLFILL